MLALTRLDQLPPGCLTVRAVDLWRIAPGPTLIHLAGRRAEPLFVSILLHGNEDVGLHAVQWLLANSGGRLEVRDETNHDVSERFLEHSEGAIRLRQPVMPSMLTCNERVIRQYCLGYFMERYPPP